MNEQQLEIISTFGVGQAVIAGAGCGKTTTLVAKCIALLKNQPKARFCAVSFTEKSVRDLRENLKKGFIDAGFDSLYVQEIGRHHWIKTIHGLCLSIIQEFPLEAGLLGGERIILQDEADELWERSLYLLWTRNENKEISDAVDRLLKAYSKTMLETNFKQLKNLISFGVDEWMQKAIVDRPEMADLWFVFQSVFDRFQQWKRKSGALDFNDLERFANIALEHPLVQKNYHERFDLVMVDEFQDTNPIQGGILEKLVKPGYGNLCIVGDPKQSIYRFRDADVSVFQDLILKLPRKHPLDINYRSVPEIIGFVNDVCAPVFEVSELDYEPLQAGREPNATIQDRVLKLMIEDERSLAQYLKSQEESGIDLSEYVILVRSVRKDKTQRYLNALDDLRVPYLLGSGGRFYSDPRVRELVAFLKGWTSPNQSLSQATALRAPWIKVSDPELLEWKDTLFENFFNRSSHPIALTLKDAYLKKMPLRPGEVLERIWDSLEEGSEMELSIASLWHKVEEYSSRGKRFEEVVNELVHAIDEDKIEKEIPTPAEKGMVRIMTIHASKGLQFPRVILLDFEGEHRGPTSSNDLIWNRKKGIHLYFRDENGDRDKKNPENEKWGELEKKAAIAESKRLFYVAITRPREQLILGFKKEVKVSKSKEPSLAADDWRFWVESTVGSRLPVIDEPVLNLSEKKNQVDHSDQSARFSGSSRIAVDANPYRPRHSASEWMILNQCKLRYQKKFFSPEWETEQKVFVGDEEAVSSVDVAEKGIRIHSLLEHENWDELILEFPNPAMGEKAAQQIKDVLGSADDASLEIHREIAFEVPFTDLGTGDEAFVGMMDRLEVNRAEGIIRVLDYKWTLKEKTPEEMRAQYQLQLELYSWAAMQLCVGEFPIHKVEAKLIHISKNGVSVVDVPIQVDSLSKRAMTLLDDSRKTLSHERQKLSNEATLGNYCRYCEFQKSCQAFQQNQK
jgi:ATP-dependent helicase/nuclease subunit A